LATYRLTACSWKWQQYAQRSSLSGAGGWTLISMGRYALTCTGPVWGRGQSSQYHHPLPWANRNRWRGDRRQPRPL